MQILVCRIQDAEGRGPYRPGFSKYWEEHDPPPAFLIQFPGLIAKMHRMFSERGGAFGCGFRTLDQARAWFLPGEVLTLAKFGYSLCWVLASEILAENDDQLVFWSELKLNQAVVHTGWTNPPWHPSAEDPHFTVINGEPVAMPAGSVMGAEMIDLEFRNRKS